MKKLCYTGIKPLGRNIRVTRSGAVVLMENPSDRGEVIWWPPIEISKEVMSTWNDLIYFVDAEGYLVSDYEPLGLL